MVYELDWSWADTFHCRWIHHSDSKGGGGTRWLGTRGSSQVLQNGSTKWGLSGDMVDIYGWYMDDIWMIYGTKHGNLNSNPNIGISPMNAGWWLSKNLRHTQNGHFHCGKSCETYRMGVRGGRQDLEDEPFRWFSQRTKPSKSPCCLSFPAIAMFDDGGNSWHHP